MTGVQTCALPILEKAELLKLDFSEYRLSGRKDTDRNGRAGTAALSLKKVERNSIRVGTKKLDELWSLVGELIINKSQLSKIAKIINSLDRKSTRLNSSHTDISRMPSSA